MQQTSNTQSYEHNRKQQDIRQDFNLLCPRSLRWMGPIIILPWKTVLDFSESIQFQRWHADRANCTSASWRKAPFQVTWNPVFLLKLKFQLRPLWRSWSLCRTRCNWRSRRWRAPSGPLMGGNSCSKVWSPTSGIKLGDFWKFLAKKFAYKSSLKDWWLLK